MIDIKTGKPMTRRNILTGLGGIIAAGCAPSIAMGAARIVSRDTLAGSANASVRRGMMRNIGGGMTAMFGWGWKNPYDFGDGSLVSMWDVGYKNPTDSSWPSVVGNGIDWSLTGVSISDDFGIVFAGSSSSYGELSAEQSALAWGNVGTLQAVIKPTPNYGERWGTVLKTPSNCIVGIAIFSGYSDPVLTCSNNTVGYTSFIKDPMSLLGKNISISASYNSTLIETLVNNKLQTTVGNDNIGGVQTVTRIGNRTTIYPFKGSVYAIRWYSRALTDTEMLGNYIEDKRRFGV